MRNNFVQYFIVAFLIFNNAIFSQITLDNGFGTNGRVLTSFGSANSNMSSIAIQSDGKILACGSYYNGTINQIALSRYKIDGSLDETFGVNGKLLTPIGTDFENEHNTVRVLSNGNILVAGTNGTSATGRDFAIVQFDSYGSLDLSFGNNGIVLSDFNNEFKLTTLEIQGNNKIVVGGTILMPTSGNKPNFAIARYNIDGSKDVGFGVNGLACVNVGVVNDNLIATEDYVNGLKIQPDGKILVSGMVVNNLGGNGDFALVRLDINGNLDSGFGNNGRVITNSGSTEEANSIEILPDGKIILSGIFYYNGNANEIIAIAKYTSGGVLDTTYGNKGQVFTNFGNSSPKIFAFSSVLQTDGKLLVIGFAKNTTADFFITRYNTNGTLDTAFGSNGVLFVDYGTNEGAYASLFQTDGKLIVGGSTNNGTNNEFTLLRFNAETLSTNGFVDKGDFGIYPNPFLDYINLDFNHDQDEVLKVNLFDINGRKLANLLDNEKIQSGNVSLKLRLPEALPKGVCFLNVSNGEKISNFRIIK